MTDEENKGIQLSPEAAQILSDRMTAYIDALSIVVATLGLKGTWKFNKETMGLEPVA